MNTKWSPAVERALHEVGDTAPLTPAFDSLPWAQPTPAAPRGRRTGTFAAAGLALAAAAALVVVVLPSDDDGSVGPASSSLASPGDPRLDEVCGVNSTGEVFTGADLEAFLAHVRRVDPMGEVFDHLVQQCDVLTVTEAQARSLAQLALAWMEQERLARMHLGVSFADGTLELSFTEFDNSARVLHGVVYALTRVPFAVADDDVPIGYLSMDRPGTVGTFTAGSTDGVQFADGVSTDKVDRYDAAGLAPGWYLVCVRLAAPALFDVCGAVRIPEP